MKQVFVSYVYEDKKHRDTIEAWAKDKRLVGQDTHSHDWVAYEVAREQSARKPVIVVRIPGTTGAVNASVRSLTEVTFEPSALRRALGT